MSPHPLYHNIQQAVHTTFKDAPKGPPRLLLVAKKAKHPTTGDHLEYLLSYLQLLPNITQLFSGHHGCKADETVQADVVTEADLNVTALVHTFINTHFQDDILIDEESETIIPPTPRGVVLFDPIDGTKEYAEGGPNCCHVFSRFAIHDNAIEDGFSLIWEPYNHTLTIAVSTYDNTTNLSTTKQIPTPATQINVGSHTHGHIERLAHVEHLLTELGPIEFQVLQSGSVELRYTLEGLCDIFIRRFHKMWDFLPGAFANFLLGHEVFFYNTNKNVFPLSLNQLTEVASLKPKSERKLKHLCITQQAEQRSLITKHSNQ